MAADGRNLTAYSFAVVITAMLAVLAYVTYQNKFQKLAFINFSQYNLYGKNDVFQATASSYVLLFYSSKSQLASELSQNIKLKSGEKIIALDLAQDRFDDTKTVICVTTGMNAILKLVHRFKVKAIPSFVYLTKVEQKIYKQKGELQYLSHSF